MEQSQYLRWREFSFLEHPEVPRTVVWSQTSLWHHLPSTPILASYATGPHVHACSEIVLKQAVAALEARVVRIQNMQPGAFLGFESDRKNSEFNGWFRAMMSDIKWCCSTQILELKQQRHDSLDFPQPLPFSTQQQTQFTVRYVLLALAPPSGQWLGGHHQ